MSPQNSKPLSGKVAVVAGATRGAGRGIARMLGEAGMTVYCSGRTVKGGEQYSKRAETIEETAEMVKKSGGKGIAVMTDHKKEDQVAALFEKVEKEEGQLHLLVNDIWGGDALTEWGKSFWELEPEKGFRMLETAVHTHIITSRYAVPVMRKGNEALIVEITDGDFAGYRGNLFYDLAKNAVIRLAYAMSCELRDTEITALALTPGFLRSEAMLEHFGVAESNWQDGIEQDPYFAESETPCYVGRAVAALAADPNVKAKAGKVWASWTLAKEYNFTDIDGRQPDFPVFFDNTVKQMINKGGPANEQERMLMLARYHQIHLDPSKTDYIKQLESSLGLKSISS